eukprot:8200800-Prorocentrum_lima.AAC.1
MTSSLVGSEMCIRDRYRCTEPELPEVSLMDLLVAPSQPTHMVSSSTTVSYTHLTLPTICSV